MENLHILKNKNQMKIPIVDLKAQHESIREEIDNAIKKVIDNSSFIGGEQVESFEKEFASYCGKKYCITTSSGTAALHLSLLAHLSLNNLKQEDEIIIPVNTFTATAEPTHFCNLKIKFADVDDFYLIDIEKLKQLISEKTRMIIPVHLYGQTADMEEISRIANEKNILIIEDSAQAHGAKQNNIRTPITETGCFSFFPAKPLGALGDGGAIVTDNEIFAERARQIRDHGRSNRTESKYEHSIIGLNYRLDAIQAAILRVKLKHLDKWIELRRKNAVLYNNLLNGIVETPKIREGNEHVYYVYTIKTDKRDALSEFLKENGISTQKYYPIPLHLQQAYGFIGYKKGDFPKAEEHANKILSLPMYPELKQEQITYVCDKIKEFFEND